MDDILHAPDSDDGIQRYRGHIDVCWDDLLDGPPRGSGASDSSRPITLSSDSEQPSSSGMDKLRRMLMAPRSRHGATPSLPSSLPDGPSVLDTTAALPCEPPGASLRDLYSAVPPPSLSSATSPLGILATAGAARHPSSLPSSLSDAHFGESDSDDSDDGDDIFLHPHRLQTARHGARRRLQLPSPPAASLSPPRAPRLPDSFSSSSSSPPPPRLPYAAFEVEHSARVHGSEPLPHSSSPVKPRGGGAATRPRHSPRDEHAGGVAPHALQLRRPVTAPAALLALPAPLGLEPRPVPAAAAPPSSDDRTAERDTPSPSSSVSSRKRLLEDADGRLWWDDGPAPTRSRGRERKRLRAADTATPSNPDAVRAYGAPPRGPHDYYTPLYVRKDGAKKEARCEHCGEWLRLASSFYWHHLHVAHGICFVSGGPISPPARLGVKGSRTEGMGLCEGCNKWVRLRGRANAELGGWFKHYTQCGLLRDKVLSRQGQAAAMPPRRAEESGPPVSVADERADHKRTDDGAAENGPADNGGHSAPRQLRVRIAFSGSGGGGGGSK